MRSSIHLRWIFIAGCTTVLAILGLAGLLVFFVPKTLDDADKWASVIAVLLAYTGLTGGVIVWAVRRALQTRPCSNPDVVSTSAGAADPSIDAPDPVPRQLERDVPDFTGRVRELRELRTLLDPDTAGDSRTVVIAALAGRGGVGKTALARHVAHLLSDQFPDGHLDVDLRGAEAVAHVRRSSDVLAEFLRAMGIDGSLVPLGEDARAALYRSRLAGKRMIILLDNAANEAQVRPLLPGSPSAAVIMTSRSRLSGLEGVNLMTLDGLTQQDGIDLLGNVASPSRVAAEQSEARSIVRLCGRLPLAIRICGAILANRPGWPLRALLTLLEDETQRLSRLSIGDLDVRASFNLSYQNTLTAPERRAFRLLGLIGARNFSGWIIGPLLGIGAEAVGRIANRLEDVHLLEPVAGVTDTTIRYQFHDLLRILAIEHLGAAEDDTQQRAAVDRLAGAYLQLVTDARELHEPTGPTAPASQPDFASADLHERATVAADPVRWFAGEVMNLVDMVQLTARFGLAKHTWQICEQLIPLLEVSSLWAEWAQVNEHGLNAARTIAGSRHAEAKLLKCRAELRRYTGELSGARQDLQESIEAFWNASDQRGAAGAMVRLGEVLRYTGDSDGALNKMIDSKALYDECGDTLGRAYALTAIGGVHRVRADFDNAIAAFQEALPILLSAGHSRQAGITLISLGDVYHLKAKWPEAIACFEECRGIFDELGDAMWTANTDRHIGIVDTILGRKEDARRRFDSALGVFKRIGDERKRGLTLWNLGELLAEQANLKEAMVCFDAALGVFEEINDLFAEAVVSNSVAWAQVAHGSVEDAERWVAISLARSEGRNQAVLIATANLSLARLRIRSGRYSDAAVIAKASLNTYQRVGALRWEPMAKDLLSECARVDPNLSGT